MDVPVGDIWRIAIQFWWWLPFVGGIALWFVARTSIVDRWKPYALRIRALCSPIALDPKDWPEFERFLKFEQSMHTRSAPAHLLTEAGHLAQRTFDKYWGREAFGTRAFQTSLAIAIYYPFALSIVWWASTGKGLFGATAEGSALGRWGEILAIVMIFAGVLYLIRKTWGNDKWQGRIAYASAYSFAFAVAVARVLGLDLADTIFIGFVGVCVAAIGGLAVIGRRSLAKLGAISGVGAVAGTPVVVVTIMACREALAIDSFSSVVMVLAVAATALSVARFANSKLEREEVYWVLVVAAVLACLSLMIVWQLPVQANAGTVLSSSSLPFVLLVFLSLSPILNAVVDWVSLGITRWCITKYLQQARFSQWAGYLAVDLISAFILAIVLYWTILYLLDLMVLFGWHIDAKAIRAAFVRDPLDPRVAWLTSMVITNVLSTGLHVVWVLFVVASRLDMREKERKALVGSITKLLRRQPLNDVEADRVARWLEIDRLMWVLLAGGLLLGLAVQFGSPALSWGIRLAAGAL